MWFIALIVEFNTNVITYTLGTTRIQILGYRNPYIIIFINCKFISGTHFSQVKVFKFSGGYVLHWTYCQIFAVLTNDKIHVREYILRILAFETYIYQTILLCCFYIRNMVCKINTIFVKLALISTSLFRADSQPVTSRLCRHFFCFFSPHFMQIVCSPEYIQSIFLCQNISIKICQSDIQIWWISVQINNPLI